MELLLFLILFPLLPAGLIVLIPHFTTRKIVARSSAAIMAATSIWLAWRCLVGGPEYFHLEAGTIDATMFGLEILIAAYLLYRCRGLPPRRLWIPALVVVQLLAMVGLEFGGQLPHVDRPLYADHFSVIMALIIGIIGSLTAVYSIGYMTEYHNHHPEIPVRRRRFFFTVFVFLSAMFGIVFSNSLSWLFFFWEVTTVCSFVLIGYARTEEAKFSSFHALGLNLLGGIGFLMAIGFEAYFAGEPTLDVDRLIAAGPALAMVPAAGIAFAGLAKAAQLPFSRWLLSAMVAPTPVSALLHSSTMVKAGVFVLVKFAPVFRGTTEGLLLALVGGITFLVTSLVAVSQNNAKRVLGCSTVANLGLVGMCAGVGTPETVWAAVLLIIFHAVAKALLFLGVGPIEHRIGSRNIELMEGLITTRPALGAIMIIGICGMFLAPFGMLISKYAALKALMDSNVLLAGLLAFGSAPTLFFWAKWMGKIVSIPHRPSDVVGPISLDKWVALGTLALGTLGACVFFPWAARWFVEPCVRHAYGATPGLATGGTAVMVGMLLVLFLLPLLYVVLPVPAVRAEGYLAGIGVERGAAFRGAMGKVHEVDMRNYYLSSFFDEHVLMRWGIRVCAALAFAMVVVSWI
ncbi:MAG TPA: proton-conducting transporter membrane subunit [Verrucomicrobiae bacterium]|nr:proton-conducting transporter membrane subunit [Verrucomicrobiae bacterium]